MKVQENFTDIAGGSVFVRQWTPAGAADAAPVVLLHDSLGCVELWRDFPEKLAGSLHRPVIAYDRLGFGKSTARKALPSYDFILEEARVCFPALLRALGITAFSLLGHSVGGAMALMIAALHDRGCKITVTEAAQAFVENRTLEGIRAARKHFDQPGPFNHLVKWHGDKARWVLDAWTRIWLSPEFGSWSLDPYLGQIRSPVLAIHGDRDEYGSLAFPERIAQGVKGPCQQAVLKDCGHVPHREQPDRVLQLISGFMEKHFPVCSQPVVDGEKTRIV